MLRMTSSHVPFNATSAPRDLRGKWRRRESNPRTSSHGPLVIAGFFLLLHPPPGPATRV